ncbi:MAG TPA: DUF763 domain-containing protein [Bryobacteraceae bacterium]|nr:DUF763 domain-containing protein [Bryobacteraceae bacterium]
MQRRLANLPLHGGKAPAWLFQRMTQLAGAMTMAVVAEYGPDEMLRRLSDPWWFQAFGCVLGFDWHSSGVTTVTCGALKEAHRKLGSELGIFVAGGKGAVSRETPMEIAELSSRHGVSVGERLIHASKMSAKVDSAAVQDGYDLYQHAFFFTRQGAWCVVQQGMNDARGDARRYHWLGESVDDFVCEPHNAIEDLSNSRQPPEPFLPLNMAASEAAGNRRASTELVRQNPDRLARIIEEAAEGPTLFAPRHHPVLPADVNCERLRKIVRVAHERNPADFEELLGTPQVGAATIRSLALIAELIYNAPCSHRDPATRPGAERKWADYSFAHGGKDGHPFPVKRGTYDQNIAVLTAAVEKARLGITDKTEALKRLAKLCD